MAGQILFCSKLREQPVKEIRIKRTILCNSGSGNTCKDKNI